MSIIAATRYVHVETSQDEVRCSSSGVFLTKIVFLGDPHMKENISDCTNNREFTIQENWIALFSFPMFQQLEK